MSDWITTLAAEAPCATALAFARGHASFAEAWQACERADWMMWWVGCVAGGDPGSAERKRLVLTACACARLALPYGRPGDARPLRAIETTERWARDAGATTLDDVRAAAADAANAADAVAYSANAADATNATNAAYAVAYAAYAADAARATMHRACCDLIRNTYPTPPLREGR